MSQTPPENMQPIEDAPQDGTRIEVWRPNYGLYSVEWRDGAWTIREGKTIPTHEVTLWRLPQPKPVTPFVDPEPSEYDLWDIENGEHEA